MKKLIILFIFFASSGLAMLVFSSELTSQVTICEGKCYQGKSENGPWKELKGGEKLSGDIYLRTDENSRLEVKNERGTIRLAPKTVFKFSSVKKKGDSSVMVSIGSVWAKIKKTTDQKKFEVKTKSAVAGVRGTVFSVTSLVDESSIIKVYEGEVGVNNRPVVERKNKEEEMKIAEAKKERKEIPPPFKEVTKKQWEEMVARAMQMIKVSAEGDISEPIAFDLEEEKKDDWVAWNISLDEKEEKKDEQK
ncbi:MAG: FecR family protein [Myxococcota bacterium]